MGSAIRTALVSSHKAEREQRTFGRIGWLKQNGDPSLVWLGQVLAVAMAIQSDREPKSPSFTMGLLWRGIRMRGCRAPRDRWGGWGWGWMGMDGEGGNRARSLEDLGISGS